MPIEKIKEMTKEDLKGCKYIRAERNVLGLSKQSKFSDELKQHVDSIICSTNKGDQVNILQTLFRSHIVREYY